MMVTLLRKYCPSSPIFTVLISTVWSPYTFSKCQQMSVGAIFSTWRNASSHLCFICTSMSDPSCQTVPLLPSVTWQQNIMGYWWEGSTSGAISPESTSDIVGQHHKTGGIIFGAALLYVIVHNAIKHFSQLFGRRSMNERPHYKGHFELQEQKCGEF